MSPPGRFFLPPCALAGEQAASGFAFEHPALDLPGLAADVRSLYARATARADALACDALPPTSGGFLPRHAGAARRPAAPPEPRSAMLLRHTPEVWTSFPSLAAGALQVRGITSAPVRAAACEAQPLLERARRRLAQNSESAFPEIQAWRRAYAAMGMKPTQYRCAAEALLRRLRLEGDLPRLHPLVTLCNAASAAYAIPLAVLDLRHVAFPLEIRPAAGTESYQGFGGDPERPEPGEIIYADPQGRAHARRWTHRQSAVSAVREDTRDALIVAECLHAGGADDIARLLDELHAALARLWQPPVVRARLSAQAPAVALQGGAQEA